MRQWVDGAVAAAAASRLAALLFAAHQPLWCACSPGSRTMAWPDGSRFLIAHGVKWGSGPKVRLAARASRV